MSGTEIGAAETRVEFAGASVVSGQHRALPTRALRCPRLTSCVMLPSETRGPAPAPIPAEPPRRRVRRKG
eukprot:2708237-Rhodomonas_salina.2